MLCLREVLERQPDQPEWRGGCWAYVPHEGGWARPFAVAELKEGIVNHPVFGWVPKDWVAHLEGGELPAPVRPRPEEARWLPAGRPTGSDRTGRIPGGSPPSTSRSRPTCPLAEAIGFARRLEAFYDLFFALMADVVGDDLPLARRFAPVADRGSVLRGPTRSITSPPRTEYVEHLRSAVGADIDKSLGYYNPPRPGKGNRGPAYFFRDPGGQLPVTATLYHEVSHQLLFETAGPNAYTRNVGNYWVFEGLGTYFETVTPQARRLASRSAAWSASGSRRPGSRSRPAGSCPLEQFVRSDQNAVQPRRGRSTCNYQQAMALTVFLMQARDAALPRSVPRLRAGRLPGPDQGPHGPIAGRPARGAARVLETQFRDFLARARRGPSAGQPVSASRAGDQHSRAGTGWSNGSSDEPIRRRGVEFTRPRRASAP